MSVSTVTSDSQSQLIEIDVNHGFHLAVTFTANGEHIVGGGGGGVGVWQVKDGKQVSTMPTEYTVQCVAVSKDGKWIAASTWSQLLVWDTTTYETVLTHNAARSGTVRGGDFSPLSARVVVSEGGTATIWDIATRKQVHTLDHDWYVFAAKYSPQGDRIATITERGVQIWDSSDGNLLVLVELGYIAEYNTTLLWSNDRLFFRTNNVINELDAITGILASQWTVPGRRYPCIALPQHGRFIAHTAGRIITFWDTSTQTQLCSIQHHHDVKSIAFSPDDQLLAIAGRDGKVSVKNLSPVTEPEILIDSVVLNLWKEGQLADVEASLTADILASQHTHHTLASRAIVRARLGNWDAAIDDATTSIKTQRSVIGYIAHSMALAGKGKVYDGCRICDIGCQHFQSTHGVILRLLKVVLLSLSGEHEDAISHMNDLMIAAPLSSILYVVQAYMYLRYGNVQVEQGDYHHAIRLYEKARVMLGNCIDQPPLIVSLISGWKFEDLAFGIEQRLCEAFLASGRPLEASEHLLQLVSQVTMTDPIKSWICDLMYQCLSMSIGNGITNWEVTSESGMAMSQETAHALYTMTSLLKEWAGLKLQTELWNDVLTAAVDFTLPRFVIYRVTCERLETVGHVLDTVACWRQMRTELGQETDSKQNNWTLDFKSRCCRKLEHLGDDAMNTQEYGVAILQYTTALSLSPAVPHDLLIKRSKAYAGQGSWENALNDANDVIKLDPSSLWGYERKHEALCAAGHHEDAIDALGMMLSKMSQSSDPEIRERSQHYVTPEETKKAIRTITQNVLRDFPLVLIHTTSGRLYDRSEQAALFESMPAFAELVSSMTTEINHGRIEEVVREFYSYATFSHTWQENEPLFNLVTKILVYDLAKYPTHEKLQMFCKIVRDAGIKWAWSDTCCIDKTDHVVLQEALVSMFKWYERSALTIIFLLGVSRLAEPGALVKSLWNSRGWTLQEYHASRVVRFYTEDWTPYLGLDMYNHKDSPEIVAEMEVATGMSSRALMALRPGLDDIREKLQLASTRQTTRAEDAAYSLLGIFSVPLPITYGDGDKALGQLLAQLLTSSGDTSILAWTGRSGSFNSCLPADVTVFSDPPSSHIPLPVSNTETKAITTGLRSLNLLLATRLYEQLHGLSVPWFAGRRMKLPCLTFKLGQVSASQSGSSFRAQTTALGIVEIRTKEDISRLGSLYLVHPWIDFLLDRQPVGGVPTAVVEESADDQSSVLGGLPSLPAPSHIASASRKSRTSRLIPRIQGLLFVGRRDSSFQDNASLVPPSTVSPKKKEAQVVQFISRIRRPFGALLLTRNRQNVEEYRRVATDSLIKVRVEEITPATLDRLIQGVRMLDVL